jgi:hypothetical protein
MGLNTVLLTAVVLLGPLSTLALPAPPNWVLTLPDASDEARNNTGGSLDRVAGLIPKDDLDLSDGIESTKELLERFKSADSHDSRIPHYPDLDADTKDSDMGMYSLLREQLAHAEKDLRLKVSDEKDTDSEFEKDFDHDYARGLDKHFEKELGEKNEGVQGVKDVTAKGLKTDVEVKDIGKVFEPHFEDKGLEHGRQQKACKQDVKKHCAGKGFRTEFKPQAFGKHSEDKDAAKPLDVSDTPRLIDGKDLKTSCAEKIAKMRASGEIRPVPFF